MTPPAATLAVDPRAALWRIGDLRWLLHDDQLDVWDTFQEWRERMREPVGKFRRVFVVEGGRRYGKDWWTLVLFLSEAIKHPSSRLTYGTAFAKDIGEIVLPLLDDITSEHCPDDVMPRYHSSKEGEQQGLYLPNGSKIKLVGIDRNRKGLRGRKSNGVAITEAAWVEHLEKAVLSELYPQLQGDLGAFILLQSSAPEVSSGNAFDEKFIPDAKQRRAFVSRTIDDNPMLSDEERDEFIAAAGGREDPRAQREYFNKRVRDPKKAIVHEFSVARHVAPVPSPEFAHCYVAADPGSTDLFGVVYGYWDTGVGPLGEALGRPKLMIQADWSAHNATTGEMAEEVKATELDLWTGVTYWDGKRLCANPYRRTTDVDPRLIADLASDHGLTFEQHDKSDDLHARTLSLNEGFRNDAIQIDPRCKALIAHLEAGTWNDAHTKWKRMPGFGHFDLIAALEVLWRSVVRTLAARPPSWILEPGQYVPDRVRQLAERRGSTAALGRALGGKRPWQR